MKSKFIFIIVYIVIIGCTKENENEYYFDYKSKEFEKIFDRIV